MKHQAFPADAGPGHVRRLGAVRRWQRPAWAARALVLAAAGLASGLAVSAAGDPVQAEARQPADSALHQASQRLDAVLPSLPAAQRQVIQRQVIQRMSGEVPAVPGQRRSDELQALVKLEAATQADHLKAKTGDAPQAARTLAGMAEGRLPSYLDDVLLLYGPTTSASGGTRWRPDRPFLKAAVDEALQSRQLDRRLLARPAGAQ